MRETIFKAIRKDNGEWIEGKPFDMKFRNEIHAFIQDGEFAYKNGSVYGKRIIPETLCQYTGLTYNKAKVFENDTFKLNQFEYQVIFENGTFKLKHIGKLEHLGVWGNLSRLFDADMESILDGIQHTGNIYETTTNK